MILNDVALRLAPVLRTTYFIPAVTTAAIVGIVMKFVVGPVNENLHGLNIIDQPIDFLGNFYPAKWTVVGVHVWKNFGITMIYRQGAL